MESLLREFRQGNIADKHRRREDEAIRSHLGALVAAWDQILPKFPDCPWRRRTFAWEFRRGRRDAYLRHLIITQVPGHETRNRLIVNPTTVIGRHARMLAGELPDYHVVGTDIDHRNDRIYRLLSFWRRPKLRNYSFVTENIFEPDLGRRPSVVTFFGACGSLTDGSMDYAISTAAPFLICRSCCHENIGGNTQMVRRPGAFNAYFAMKNWGFARYKRKENGFYFSDRYFKDAYPRSKAAREMMDSETIVAIAQNAVDSDVCRSLIDLDRCLYLQEHGYDVMYREELFFAHMRPEAAD